MSTEKLQYTPGPWNVDERFICDVVAGNLKISTSWSEDEAGLRLKVADVPMPSPQEQEANTRLIAAAPDMYEALQYYKEALDYIIPKLNLGASFLDAQAISYMNQMSIKGQQALSKATNL